MDKAADSGWRTDLENAQTGDDVLLYSGHVGNICIVASFETDPEHAAYPWETLDGPSYPAGWPTHWMPLPAPPEDQP